MTESQAVFIVKIYFFKNYLDPTSLARTAGVSFLHQKGVAFELDHLFVAAGLSNGGEILTVKKVNTKSSNCKDWTLEFFNDSEPEEVIVDPGIFYKRIYRPSSSPLASNPRMVAYYQDAANSAFIVLKMLLDKLEELFETVEPTKENKNCYGHKIREVLLLACMEVESAWKAVLEENQYESKGKLTTNDYVKLKKIMFLDAYSVTLTHYPNSFEFNPFDSWSEDEPTKSLPWYQAYNNTKHDREAKLSEATLETVVHAVAAVLIIFHAQFGYFAPSLTDSRLQIINKTFKINTAKMEKYERESYIAEWLPDGDSARLAQTNNWRAINYPF